MPGRRRFPASWLPLAVLLTTAGVAHANHTIFSAAVERFDIDGPQFASSGARFGPHDGVPDLVDEFDDPLAGSFGGTSGTVTEHDGALFLTSPGTHQVRDGVTYDRSEARSAFFIYKDASDYTARSFWRSGPPPPNQFISLTVFSDFEYYTVGLDNTGGLSLFQQVRRPLVPGPEGTDRIFIDPSEVTGSVILGFDYQQFNNIARAFYSLDGGVTFRRPFFGWQVFVTTDVHTFALGIDTADNPVIPTSSTTSTSSSTTTSTSTSTTFPPGPCGGGGTATSPILKIAHVQPPVGDEALTFRTTQATPFLAKAEYQADLTGVRIRLARPGDPPLVDVAIPGGPPGSACGSRDGWRRRVKLTVPPTYTYGYTNVTNALPPACIPGSAGGIRKVQIVDKIGASTVPPGPPPSTLAVKATFSRVTVPTPAPPMQAMVAFGAASGLEAAGRCALIDLTTMKSSSLTVTLLP